MLSNIQKFLTSTDRRTEQEITQFEKEGKDLYRLFVDMDKKNSGKWYLHVLTHHVGQQLRQEKSIAPYTCSPQERVNGQHYHMLQTCVQFHNSSRQLLEMKRLECMFEYVMPEYAKKKRAYPVGRKMPTREQECRRKSEPLTEGEQPRGTVKNSKKRVLSIM